jgi:NADH-quinone oxidoreductase subunit H
MNDNLPANDQAAEPLARAAQPDSAGPQASPQSDQQTAVPPVNEKFLHPRLSVLQPMANTVKILIQPEHWPAESVNRVLITIAPWCAITIALLVYLIVPIGPAFQTTDLNIGLLFILGIGSLGIYSIVLENWLSRTEKLLASAMRSAAHFLSYETASALALVSALLLTGSLSMNEIVQAQLDQGQWFLFYVPVGFGIFFLSSIALTYRTAIVMPESDPEIIGESGKKPPHFRWALDSLADYAKIFVAAGVATTVFLGGWLRPLASYRDRFPGTPVQILDVVPGAAVAAIALYCLRSAQKQQEPGRKRVMIWACGIWGMAALALIGTLFAPEAIMTGVHGAFWFVMKVSAYVFCCLWVRITFPEYRSDPSTNLGWRILVPMALVNLLATAMAIVSTQYTGLPMRLTTILAAGVTLGAGIWLSTISPTETAGQMAASE